MLKRILIATVVVVGLLLLLLFVAGSGWLAAEVSAGRPTEFTRTTSDLDSRFVHQLETARDLGVAASRESQTQILFGDFHVHTSFSPDAFTQGMPLTGGTGSHTISDACDFARFCSNLDFWSVNDHAEGSTPRRWKDTIEAIGRCDAVFDPEDPGAERDLISFVGWEWSHMGTTAENHFGHRNVILRDLDPERLPTRPIASDSPARYFPETSTLLLGLMPFLAGDLDYLRYANYQQETASVARCPSGVPVRQLPNDCREHAATPGELLEKLDEWGFESLVIPHGTTWGMYTPQGSSYAKQLRPDWIDPVRQRLVEVYSGHGNTEPYRDWRAIERGDAGERICPMPSDDYVPGCWQAGEIIRKRCADEGLEAALCDARAVVARQRYADAPAGMGHLSVPGWTADEWGDAGQCRDCFQPAFSYRPQSSVQAMLALSRESDDGDRPLRFRFGFVGSSDNHTARPGSGYKEVARTAMTDVRLSRVDLPIRLPEEEPVAESRVASPEDLPPNKWLEQDRIGSFFYTGGLVAVHAAKRERRAVWNALESRETYATSGPRILLWFDLLNPPAGASKGPIRKAAMGSAVEMNEPPIFRVRAAGSRIQLPGCPASTRAALTPDRLERLCRGECDNPSDERRLITRIEVVRIRPQLDADEDLDPLIEDPWRSFECESDPTGCVVTFSDPEFPELGRDAVYYARAIEEPSETINGGNLGCKPSSDGKIACEKLAPCAPWAADSDECLTPNEHRAWSSPIFLDRSRPQKSARIGG